MKTRTTIHWLAGIAGGLLLVVPVLGWAARDWGPGGVPGALQVCQWDLELCEWELEQSPILPGDGWPEDGYPSGGVPLAYENNWDGTFTDLNTKLMWEHKWGTVGEPVECSHETFPVPQCLNVWDVDNRYTWTEADDDLTDPDGPAFVFFLEMRNHTCGGEMYQVNCETDADCAGEIYPYCGLGGHMDWRLPTVKELQSLVDYSTYNPAVSDELPGATVADDYWSSTSDASWEFYAWSVDFHLGLVSSGNVLGPYKSFDYRVRAVRGGR